MVGFFFTLLAFFKKIKFFRLLFILCICHIMPPSATHLPPTPNKTIKYKRKRIKRKRENLVIEACVTLRGLPLYPYIFTWRHLSQRIIDLVWGPWSLLYHWCWALTGTLAGHPIAALCHEILQPWVHTTDPLSPPCCRWVCCWILTAPLGEG